jgi:hypothetical protein
MRIRCLPLLALSLAISVGDSVAAAAASFPLPLFAPLFAQGVGALVQPGGIEGLAQQPPRPAAVQAPEGGAPPAGDQNNAEEKPGTGSKASPFEIRYIMSYVLMLTFVGGSTFLIIRPSGRKTQGDGGAAKGKDKTAAKTKK